MFKQFKNQLPYEFKVAGTSCTTLRDIFIRMLIIQVLIRMSLKVVKLVPATLTQ